MYLLWRYIGVASLAGLLTMAIFVPINIVISYINKKFRRQKMAITDSRIKTTNEILNGVKVNYHLQIITKIMHKISI